MVLEHVGDAVQGVDVDDAASRKTCPMFSKQSLACSYAESGMDPLGAIPSCPEVNRRLEPEGTTTPWAYLAKGGKTLSGSGLTTVVALAIVVLKLEFSRRPAWSDDRKPPLPIPLR